MSQVIKKFIGDDQVGASKILLENNTALRARNAADSADVDMFLVDAADTINVMGSMIPSTNASFELGSSTREFSNVHAQLIQAQGGLDVRSATDNINLGAALGVNIADPSNTIALPLRFFNAAGTFSAAIQAPALSASYTLTLPVDDGTPSQVLTTNGTGTLSWSTPAAAGANTALSNLITTSINQSLLPDGDATRSLGSASLRWLNASFQFLRDQAGIIALTNSLRTLHDTSGVVSIDFDGRSLQDSGGIPYVIWSGPDLVLQSDAELVSIAGFGGTTAPSLAFFNATNTQTVSFKVDDALAASQVYQLPSVDGSAGDVLSTDGAGILSFITPSGSSATNQKELVVLSGTDITNQYVDLANVALNDSISFLVKGGGVQIEGASYDYSVSYTGGAGGNTRITFLNDLATGGLSALIAGDVVVAQYQF